MKEIKGIIYKYTNIDNGKVYIGQTINEEERIKQHKYAYDKTPFEKAVKEEGFDNFKYSVIYRVTGWNKDLVCKVLNLMEVYYIELYNSTLKSNGYNIDIGGKQTHLNKIKAPLICVETGDKYNSIYELGKCIHLSPIKLLNDILKNKSIREKHYVFSNEYNLPAHYPSLDDVK